MFFSSSFRQFCDGFLACDQPHNKSNFAERALQCSKPREISSFYGSKKVIHFQAEMPEKVCRDVKKCNRFLLSFEWPSNIVFLCKLDEEEEDPMPNRQAH